MPADVALLRCSTDAQDLAHQRAAALRWGQANGVELEIREEPATSGCAARRPVLEQLLADARAGRVRLIWVRELSRLGRSLLGVVQVLDELHRLGVRLVSAKEGVDYSTPHGRFVAQVMASFAELERETIRERTRSGMAAARARGVRIGRPRLQWRDEELEDLRALRAQGVPWTRIHRDGLVKVFQLVDGEERAVVPSPRAMKRALAEAGAA